ncbi:hypothetical protein GU930_16330 [Pantoea vagans]|nr:hypothetical protein [Pantoea vagans]NBB56676.1 hypothetical protein [Pantoea vagans]
MKKSYFLLVALMVFSFQSLADTIKNGVLQAYWLPQLEGEVNTPKLQLRFFPFSDDAKQEAIINIDSSDLKENFVKDNFGSYTKDFFEVKEGHIERNGVIKLKNIKKSQECDSTVWQAKIISFKGNDKNFKVDESKSECNAYPYIISYQLKEGTGSIFLKDKPDENGKAISQIDNQHSLIKIKGINSKWLYVAEYDPSKANLLGERKGYVEYSELQPLN